MIDAETYLDQQLNLLNQTTGQPADAQAQPADAQLNASDYLDQMLSKQNNILQNHDSLNKLQAQQNQDNLAGAFSGIGQGVTSLFTAPIDLGASVIPALHNAGEWAGTKAANAITGKNEQPNYVAMPPSLSNAVNKELGIDYKPTTPLGKYLQTIGQFTVPAGMAEMSIADAIRYGIIPAITSETVGQLTQGTPIDPYARAATALATGGLTSLTDQPPAVQKLLTEAAPNLTKEQINLAQSLMNQANLLGTPLTAAEAIQHVTNGSTGLSAMQRVLENNPKSQQYLSSIMAQRPQANQTSATNIFGQVSPNVMNSYELGTNAQNAAQNIIDNTRKDINAATQPFYQASENTLIAPQDYAGLSENPSYQLALKQIRNDPELNQAIAHLPDNSVGVLNAVKKRLNTLSLNAANPTSENQDLFKSGMRDSAADATRFYAANASPYYADALEQQQLLRQQQLEPLQNGPVGNIAATNNPQQQINGIFPTNPLAGSESDVANAIAKISGIDPETAQNLVRQHLETNFNEANQANMGGQNPFGGAKYASNIAGNPQQKSNLEAAITALPDGANKWQSVNTLLKVFQAQGQRLPTNSATSFNELIKQQLTKSQPLEEVAALATSPESLLNFGKTTLKNWRFNKNANDLAQLLANQQGAAKIGNYLYNDNTYGIGLPALNSYLVQPFNIGGVK